MAALKLLSFLLMFMYFGDLNTAVLSLRSFGEIAAVRVLLIGFHDGLSVLLMFAL